MTITLLRPRLVQQIIPEIEAVLTRWVGWLRSSRYLAFGDNPRPVYEIEDDLVTIVERIDRLRLQFDYGNATPDAIVVYRAAREHLYLAVEFVEKVRMRDCGSTEQTQKLLHFLTTAHEQLMQLADMEPTVYNSKKVVPYVDR
jgi:hypothetical protein